MTVSILIRTEGQQIPRPFNRASSLEELDELLTHWIRYNKVAIMECRIRDNFGSDNPIVVAYGPTGKVEFFAFMER